MSLALSCPFVQFEDLHEKLTKNELIEFVKENFITKNDVVQIVRDTAFYIHPDKKAIVYIDTDKLKKELT